MVCLRVFGRSQCKRSVLLTAVCLLEGHFTINFFGVTSLYFLLMWNHGFARRRALQKLFAQAIVPGLPETIRNQCVHDLRAYDRGRDQFHQAEDYVIATTDWSRLRFCHLTLLVITCWSRSYAVPLVAHCMLSIHR